MKSSVSFLHRFPGLLALGGLVLLLLCLLLFVADSAQGNQTLTQEEKLQLAQDFAPVLNFHEEEDFYPIAVEYQLTASNLNQSLDNETQVKAFPSAQDLENYTDPEDRYYLDNIHGTVNDSGVLEDYLARKGDFNVTVYARVTNGSNRGRNYHLIQYWIFYAFNKGTMNTHEGDWELVQLAVDQATGKPIEAFYSQHTEGQKALWTDVEKDGDHPQVYVAKGSHANYFRPYQGKLSFARDEVADNGEVLKPADYSLVLLGEPGPGNRPDEQAWLDFGGRWGEYGSDEDELRGKRGPPGPAFREEGEMWNEPMEWGSNLQSVDSTLLTINWVFYNFAMLFIGFAILSFLVKLFLILRRRKKTGLGPRIFTILDIDGVNAKSLGNLLVLLGIVFAIMSFYHPWYQVSVEIDSGDHQTNGMVEVVKIDGVDGFQLNKLEQGEGLIQMVAFPIPFWMIIGLGIFFLFLSTAGIRTGKNLSKKYFRAGLKLLLPILIILFLVAQLPAVLGMSPSEIPVEMEELVETIAGSPHQGSETKELGDYGNAHISWGLELGGWYLAVGGILMIIGSFLVRGAGKEIYPSKQDKERQEQAAEQQQHIQQAAEKDGAAPGAGKTPTAILSPEEMASLGAQKEAAPSSAPEQGKGLDELFTSSPEPGSAPPTSTATLGRIKAPEERNSTQSKGSPLLSTFKSSKPQRTQAEPEKKKKPAPAAEEEKKEVVRNQPWNLGVGSSKEIEKPSTLLKAKKVAKTEKAGKAEKAKPASKAEPAGGESWKLSGGDDEDEVELLKD
jgi:hypothetical protein